MKEQYKIYNFDHGLKQPAKVEFGPFTIVINKNHCKNISNIPHDKEYIFAYDTSGSKIRPIIKEKPRIYGNWIETSLIEVEKSKNIKSILYGDDSHSSIDDLCLIFSFLTGRRVIYEDDYKMLFHNPYMHVDRVVHKGFILRSVLNWENIGRIKKHNLGIQFYNLTLGYESKDLIAKGAYVNSSFNGIYDEWLKTNKLKKCIEEKYNGKLIDKSFKLEIKRMANKYFEKEDINPIVKEDFFKRLNGIYHPTATTKIGLFLESLDLYNGYTELEKDRLQWLSKIRNSFAHIGSIPKDKSYNYRMRIEIASSITSIVMQIAQYYFASQVLKIDDPYIEYKKNKIVSFFHKGKFDNKIVFGETFDQYIERTKNDWISP